MYRATKKYEDWPAVRQVRDGVAVTAGPWRRVVKGPIEEYSYAPITLAGYEAPTRSDLPGGDLGTVKIIRRRHEVNGRRLLQRSFKIEWTPPEGATERQPVMAGAGPCATWQDALQCIAEDLDLVSPIRAWAQSCYDPKKWKGVRPFLVEHPWREPGEPNARFSSFTLVGPWRMQGEDEIVVAHQYAATPATMREFAKRCHANAFLTQDDDGQWHVWHRHDMHYSDPIDLADFYARLIAGTQD